MGAFDLLVLGDVNPDLVLSGGDVVPAFGQAERIVHDARLTVGGSGAILACAAARLGLRVALCGVVGDDHFGDWMRSELDAKDVDVRGVVVESGRATGLTVVFSKSDDRAMLTMTGTIADLDASKIEPGLLADASHVHVSSYFLQRALHADLRDIFEGVRDRGGTTSIDPNWDPTDAWDGGLRDLLKLTDVFLPNEMELLRIARISDVNEAVRRLHDRGGAIVVKQGDRGASAHTSDRDVRVAAIPTDVVDTTGAGDCFDAGFLAGWLDGQPLERCVALGNACGALSTSKAGGVAAQPTMDEAVAALEGAMAS